MGVGHQGTRQAAHEDEGDVEYRQHVGQRKRRLVAQPDIEQGAVQAMIGHRGMGGVDRGHGTDDRSAGLLNG